MPGRGLLMLPISKALRRRNDGEIHESGYDGRVSSHRSKYRPKEGVRRGGAHPGGLWARPGATPRRVVPWAARGSPLAQLRFAGLLLSFGLSANMSGLEDSQNDFREPSVELDPSTSREKTDSNPGSYNSHGLPKATTRQRKKLNSDEEDSDFVLEETSVSPKAPKKTIKK
ncbi:hypothetical protein ZWY2020_028099 [Hordeum vulgare]|nr:hypothetical protein ZWY2020_028099 [Hordeum vulgare]